jgi:GDP-mannose 6-dehydrogenase
MRVSVFGLGYVGAVSAGCLAKSGHHVIGADTQQVKVDHINAGQSPILEDGISELIAEVVRGGRLRATRSAAEAVAESDLSIVCVGTPSAPSGKLDLAHLASVSQDIGAALAGKKSPHTVVVRSTVLPGTVEEQVIPILEGASRRRLGDGYRVLYNPEFLREGTAIADFFSPPLTVVGAMGGESADALRELYRSIDAPFHVVPVRVAEMLKYSANAFHGLKIAFANEIGRLAKRLGADSHVVMDLLCQDTKLNISRAYLRPGFAFGGSCLPKDLRALTHRAREADVSMPLLDSIIPSNERHIELAMETVRDAARKRIGLLGLSFKPGTDDLRESPLVTLAERLIGKGYELQVYDPLVNLDRLIGANKTYILREIPHISRLMAPAVAAVVDFAEVLILGNASREFKVLESHAFRAEQVVVDLTGLLKGKVKPPVEYHGVCW